MLLLLLWAKIKISPRFSPRWGTLSVLRIKGGNILMELCDSMLFSSTFEAKIHDRELTMQFSAWKDQHRGVSWLQRLVCVCQEAHVTWWRLSAVISEAALKQSEALAHCALWLQPLNYRWLFNFSTSVISAPNLKVFLLWHCAGRSPWSDTTKTLNFKQMNSCSLGKTGRASLWFCFCCLTCQVLTAHLLRNEDRALE